MPALSTVSLLKWVEEHRSLVGRPIMSHEMIWRDDFIVMLFDGPTPPNRSDFHINTSPEFFYQMQGEMDCRVLENGAFSNITVGEGEMFFLPANVPHLNSRKEHSLGLVIHQKRMLGAKDSIVWYCERCCHQLYRADYVFEDLKAQLQEHIRRFLGDEALRTCSECGTVMPAERGYM
jgi:3-hydroxyanthranilate 3,4-dioxygenase